ncbi:MAG: MarR family winged helix-turn-helix transcriptional regulator [Oscillospiraceae bacterium]
MRAESEQKSCEGMDEQKILLEQLHRSGRFIYHRVSNARGQGCVLKILAEHPSITQKELLALQNIQPGSLSEILTKLERKGLITRTKDELDKRKVCVSLTEAGKKESAKRLVEVNRNDLFTGLEPEERQELLRLLTKLNQSWDERYCKKDCGRRNDEEASREEK